MEPPEQSEQSAAEAGRGPEYLLPPSHPNPSISFTRDLLELHHHLLTTDRRYRLAFYTAAIGIVSLIVLLLGLYLYPTGRRRRQNDSPNSSSSSSASTMMMMDDNGDDEREAKRRRALRRFDHRPNKDKSNESSDGGTSNNNKRQKISSDQIDDNINNADGEGEKQLQQPSSTSSFSVEANGILGATLNNNNNNNNNNTAAANGDDNANEGVAIHVGNDTRNEQHPTTSTTSTGTALNDTTRRGDPTSSTRDAIAHHAGADGVLSAVAANGIEKDAGGGDDHKCADMKTDGPKKEVKEEKEEKEETQGNGQSSNDTYARLAHGQGQESQSQSRKTSSKTSRPAPPPVQILCETLSIVCNVDVTVKPGGDGFWGGNGWMKKKFGRSRTLASATAPSTGSSTIVLPLVDMQDMADYDSKELRGPQGKDWARLEAALSSMVSSDELGNPFHIIMIARGSMPVPGSGRSTKCNLKAIASLYAKCHGSSLRDAIDQASRCFGSYDVAADDKIALERCIMVLAKSCAGSIANALEGDIASTSTRTDVDDDSDDEEDLFSDDYKEVDNASANMYQPVSTNSVTGQCLALCSGNDLTMSKRLLGDVFSESPNPSHLALGLVKSAVRGPGLGHAQGSCATCTIASSNDTSKSLAAISHLFRNSTDICAAIVSKMKSYTAWKQLLSGSELEESSLLRHVFMLGGMTLPCAGFEGGVLAACQDMRFYESLKSVDTFPLGAFDPSSGFRLDAAILKVMEEARIEMKLARSTSAIVLENCMRRGGKPHVLRWLGRLIESNEPHANFLGDQLFDPNDEAHEKLSSRSFILGISSALLKMSCGNLVQAYDRKPSSFEPRYLVSSISAFDLSSKEAYLMDRGDAPLIPQDSKAVSGATELFFITSSLLRVSLFPALRIQKEYSHRFRHVFDRLKTTAREHGVRTKVPDNLSRYAGGFLGLEALLDDRELISEAVSFCTLQLRFVSDLVDRKDAAKVFTMLPEYIAKLPAHFIAHAALRHQTSISPLQGEQVIASATKLLGAGFGLSTTVQIDLISICSAFVKSGIQRAIARKKRGGRRTRGSYSAESDEGVIDRRELDIYTSLDRNDHGVTVFTSTFVANKLGPALIKSFVALNLATFDAEKENSNKNQAQSDIADLILRLWAHPSGDCRRSITALCEEDLSDFLRSVCATIGIEMDCVFQSLYDITDIIRQKPRNSRLGYNEKRTMDSRASFLASFLGQSRRFLMLLACLSEDDRIASIIGGGSSTVSKDVAALVVSIFDKLTSANGTTNSRIDFREFHLSSFGNSQRGMTMAHPAEEILYARLFVRNEFGLDVAMLCHLLLGLCSRWHSASMKLGQGDGLANCIVSNDDFDPSHWHNIFQRFVATHQDLDEVQNAQDLKFIEKTDGHVAPWMWKDKYEAPHNIGLEESKRSREYSSQQDQFTHAQIDQQVTNISGIGTFVLDLQQRHETKKTSHTSTDTEALERTILGDSGSFGDEDYTNYMKDWLVSSDSFTSGPLGALDHFYASNVQAASNPSLGKRLIKDAKRVWKDLPRPHPAASIFTCYSEERMDIARSIIAGAEGTPYALGIFVFDIFYPQTYPSTAPLIHFMTTGGGTVRFHPNLYNDGKVCLSLLGTTSAGDTSQPWNPDHSSLAQVLLSIQSQILSVAEPFFSEGGGHGGMRNTRAGMEGSARYNASLRLATLRHAIIAPLKSPPRGFEDVVHRHFAMCRKRLILQAKLWTLEAHGTELYSRYLRAYSELSSLLADTSLKLRSAWELNDGESERKEIGAISPLRSDLDRLAELDLKVHSDFQSFLEKSASQAGSGGSQDRKGIMSGDGTHRGNSKQHHVSRHHHWHHPLTIHQ